MEKIQLKLSSNTMLQSCQLSLVGKLFTKQAIISNNVCAEWKTYHHILLTQPNDNLKLLLKGLLINDTFLPLFCLSILVSTASAERSFSQTKLIMNHLRNHISEHSLSKLLKIELESPDQLSDSDLECIASIRREVGLLGKGMH